MLARVEHPLQPVIQEVLAASIEQTQQSASRWSVCECEDVLCECVVSVRVCCEFYQFTWGHNHQG